MVSRRFDWIMLAGFLVGGCAFACCLLEYAQAQPIINPPLAPPPTFNPSSPNTVTQPSYTPSSPARSSSQGYVFTSRANGSRSHTAHVRRRASVINAGSIYYRPGPIILGPPPVAYSYYYSGLGYGFRCAWQRSWDGYWFRTSTVPDSDERREIARLFA
jgi:hypothetical protein